MERELLNFPSTKLVLNFHTMFIHITSDRNLMYFNRFICDRKKYLASLTKIGLGRASLFYKHATDFTCKIFRHLFIRFVQ